MRIGVPRELEPGERRVALVPDAVSRLAGSGFEIVVELPKVQAEDALPQSRFVAPFRSMSAADATTSVVFFVARSTDAVTPR